MKERQFFLGWCCFYSLLQRGLLGELKAKSRARVIEAKVSIQDSIEYVRIQSLNRHCKSVLRAQPMCAFMHVYERDQGKHQESAASPTPDQISLRQQ